VGFYEPEFAFKQKESILPFYAFFFSMHTHLFSLMKIK